MCSVYSHAPESLFMGGLGAVLCVCVCVCVCACVGEIMSAPSLWVLIELSVSDWMIKKAIKTVTAFRTASHHTKTRILMLNITIQCTVLVQRSACVS